MKPQKIPTEALLATIYQLASENPHGYTHIKLSHLDQLRLEIIALKMQNAKLQKNNGELRNSVTYAKDRITELNSQMAVITYEGNSFENTLNKNLLNIRG